MIEMRQDYSTVQNMPFLMNNQEHHREIQVNKAAFLTKDHFTYTVLSATQMSSATSAV